MENLPHSQHPNMLSKKLFTNPSKTVYEDVFGGPPRFGVAPTLSPRVEDYSEIFGGFHAPRGASSSIPVLDLPLVDNEAAEDVFFDVRSCSGFDYNEVFGGFNGSDFAVSFEELMMKQSDARDFSSDEAWYGYFVLLKLAFLSFSGVFVFIYNVKKMCAVIVFLCF
jgi:hypothetical protein